MYKKITIGPINTSQHELIDLLKGWVVISIAFALGRGNILETLLITSIAVGTGFLIHELCHKFMAQYYGCFAEFRAYNEMLILALILAFATGFVFAAPGAVFVHGHVTRRENGIIAAVGPLSNYLCALVFLGLLFVLPQFFQIWVVGYFTNAWLGLFNLIPLGPFDGKKISDWDLKPYLLLVAIGFGLMYGVPRLF